MKEKESIKDDVSEDIITENESDREKDKQSKRDAVDAAIERQRRSEEYGYSDMKESYTPDIHDVADPPAPRLGIGKILKYIGIGLVLLVYMLIFIRIYYQNNTGLKSVSALIANRETIAAYSDAMENGKEFKVYTHPLSSHYAVISTDDKGNPTETMTVTYDNFSSSKDFYGLLSISNFAYYETSKQIVITVRYNRESLKVLKSIYKTEDLPSEPFFFVLDDGENYYDSYSYTEDSRFTYNYRRLIFNGVSLDDVSRLSLNVYYSEDIGSYASMLDFFNIYHSSTPLTEVTKGKGELGYLTKDIKNCIKD